MIDLLLVLLRPALRAVEGGSRNPLDWLAALIAGPLDVVIAHTTLRALGARPQRNEWTVSHVLERVCRDTAHPEHAFFVATACMINRRAPTGAHIKAVRV